MARKEDQKKIFGKMVAKAWTDEEYKARLLSDPKSVFKENDVDVPDGVEIKIVEDTGKVKHYTLPPSPVEGELRDEDLEKVSGGYCSDLCDW